MRLLPLHMSATPSGSSASLATWVIGLNAALQKRFVLDASTQLIPGNVHRAASISTGIGGKGQDVALTLKCIHYNHDAAAPFHLLQFIGTGYEGDTVYNTMMETFESDACFQSTTIRTQSKMRTCTSIVAQQSTTELVEPSGVVLPEEVESLLEAIRTTQASYSDTPPTALCFMGSMPPGCPSDLYTRIFQTIACDAQSSPPPQVRCLMDTVVGLEPLLEEIRQTPNVQSVLKINVAELGRYVKMTLPNQEEAEGAPLDFVVKAISKFWSTQRSTSAPLVPNVIALTNGAHPAYLAVAQDSVSPSSDATSSATAGFDLYRIPIASPRLLRRSPTDEIDASSPLYPIGAGDAVAAGTLAAWNYLSQREHPATLPLALLPVELQEVLTPSNTAIPPIVSAFRWGLACGSASCVMEENSVVRMADVMHLYQATSPEADLLSPSTHSIPLSPDETGR